VYGKDEEIAMYGDGFSSALSLLQAFLFLCIDNLNLILMLISQEYITITLPTVIALYIEAKACYVHSEFIERTFQTQYKR
jgi:hypothetical protein